MLVRFSRTVTLPCVVVTGPLFSPATHVGWSAPCRFEYMAVAMGYNTQGINALTLRRQAPVTHVWHCATKWLCHQVWPCIDMLGIYVLPFIWLFVCTGCRLLHTAERAWLPSYCSPIEPFALSLCLADFWLAQGLITSSGVPAKASTGSTWIIMLYVSSIQVSSRLVKPPFKVDVGICRHSAAHTSRG